MPAMSVNKQYFENLFALLLCLEITGCAATLPELKTPLGSRVRSL